MPSDNLSSMQLRCVIIDDEPLARECIANYVREVEFLTLVATANNPIELTAILAEQQVDLIFLDIQMPKMNGIDFLKMTAHPPMVIITTAYPSYALEGFQLDVLDYLLKPITFNRFFKAISKAKDYHRLLSHSEPPDIQTEQKPEYFFIKCDHKYEKVYLDDILFVQALQNYVVIVTEKGKYVTLLYLKTVEEKLNKQAFIRVHKSYVVAIAKIDSIETHELVIQSHRIPISRTHRERVLSQVVDGKLWKK